MFGTVKGTRSSTSCWLKKNLHFYYSDICICYSTQHVVHLRSFTMQSNIYDTHLSTVFPGSIRRDEQRLPIATSLSSETSFSPCRLNYWIRWILRDLISNVFPPPPLPLPTDNIRVVYSLWYSKEDLRLVPRYQSFVSFHECHTDPRCNDDTVKPTQSKSRELEESIPTVSDRVPLESPRGAWKRSFLRFVLSFSFWRVVWILTPTSRQAESMLSS